MTALAPIETRFECRFRNRGTLGEHGVADDRRMNHCAFGDRNIRPDDGVYNLRTRRDRNRRDDDRALDGASAGRILQQFPVGFKHGFGFSAVEPLVDNEGLELRPALDHELEGVRDLVLVVGGDVAVDDLPDCSEEGGPVAQIVQAHQREVGRRVGGFLHQAGDAAAGDLAHPEAAGVLDFLDTQDTGFLCHHLREVGLDDRVPEDDQQRFPRCRPRCASGRPRARCRAALPDRRIRPEYSGIAAARTARSALPCNRRSKRSCSAGAESRRPGCAK